MKTLAEVIAEFSPYEIQVRYTGSHYICNPPVETTDIDYIIYCKPEDWNSVITKTRSLGFTAQASYFSEYSESAKTQFISFKKDKLNYIITPHDEYFDKFVNATELAKRLNLLEKEARIELFHFVIHETLKDLEGESEEEDVPAVNFATYGLDFPRYQRFYSDALTLASRPVFTASPVVTNTNSRYARIANAINRMVTNYYTA